MSRPEPAVVAHSLPLPFFLRGSLLCSLTIYVISTFPQLEDPVRTRTQVSHSFPLICSNTRAEPVDGSLIAIEVVSNLTGTPSKLAATICTWTGPAEPFSVLWGEETCPNPKSSHSLSASEGAGSFIHAAYARGIESPPVDRGVTIAWTYGSMSGPSRTGFNAFSRKAEDDAARCRLGVRWYSVGRLMLSRRVGD